MAYGVSAAGVAYGAAVFLSRRDVAMRDIWVWTKRPAGTGLRWLRAQALFMLSGVLTGLVLAALATAYVLALRHVPWAVDVLHQNDAARARYPGMDGAIFVVAVVVAPPAEEFLFRGLLFRALDREWPGWRAVAGSAVFFASYHPVLSWLPVGLLGAANAVLFKRTGRLAPAVAAHVAYNAAVLGWQLV